MHKLCKLNNKKKYSKARVSGEPGWGEDGADFSIICDNQDKPQKKVKISTNTEND